MPEEMSHDQGASDVFVTGNGASLALCLAWDWGWSSHWATAGWAELAEWLQAEWLLATFGRWKGEAMEACRRFEAKRKT